MGTLISLIEEHITESVAVHQQTLAALAAPALRAANHLVDCLSRGHKILTCGNGGSACDALHFSSELLNRFEKERAPLPAIALTADCATLTAIGNDYHFNQVFAKQVWALGQKGDVLLCFTTSGNSANILEAIKTAHEKEMTVIMATGATGGKATEMLSPQDIMLKVPSTRTARIQEIHLLLVHVLCATIETTVLKGAEKASHHCEEC